MHTGATRKQTCASTAEKKREKERYTRKKTHTQSHCTGEKKTKSSRRRAPSAPRPQNSVPRSGRSSCPAKEKIVLEPPPPHKPVQQPRLLIQLFHFDIIGERKGFFTGDILLLNIYLRILERRASNASSSRPLGA